MADSPGCPAMGDAAGDRAGPWPVSSPGAVAGAGHDPGKIIADLAASVALGGDCLADIAVLREQQIIAAEPTACLRRWA